ncbi:MAG: glycosyltransferase family 8 protein [Planctomycetaceae bacterium]
MQPLPVFLAANDAYACFASTTMMSIAETTAARVEFHLFDDGIAPGRRRKLVQAMSRYAHVRLTLHDDLERRLDGCVTSWYPTRAIFSRYFIAELFPDYDLSLYADVDTVFQTDIAEIFAFGAGDQGLAACRDMGIHTVVDPAAHKARLGIDQEHVYFNNGLLLIGGEWWRRHRVAERLTRIAIERRAEMVFPSQDPMNIQFSPNRYRSLPQRYNVMPTGGSPWCEPAVFHFTWPKPWYDPRVPGGDRFWDLARRSPFAAEIWWQCQRWRAGTPVRWLRRRLDGGKALPVRR